MMKDQEIRNVFKGEWEIPNNVETKMKEAYGWIGAKHETLQDAGGNKRCQHQRRRYLKAASLVAAVLLIGTTAAAAAGFDFSLLQQVFSKNAGLVKQSSMKPEVAVQNEGYDHLEIEVEGISGTAEVTYVMLHVKRTDGHTFRKGAKFTFEDCSLNSEEDRWDTEGIQSWGNFSQFLVTENEGTSELRMVLVCIHQRMANDHCDNRLGERYTLDLGNLKELPEGEGEGTAVAKGKTKLSFVLDYEQAKTRNKKTNIALSFPKSGKKGKYESVGKLKEVIVTPYYIKYVTEEKGALSTNVYDEKDVWQQIFVEMDDGSKMGFGTEEEWNAYIMSEQEGESHLSYYANGVFVNSKAGLRTEHIQGFPKLIDVEHVKAVYLGKTKVELD